ncbi:hypothetical protein [Rhizosphaericola mali]|uniref:Uncharacterized protein n=1 Tax=Rhizosphaericola mali TaxID=2545455 RepID=A0A5P2G413_9BACT|nr:hypothetical protein [Rhizosphaericola mali]QES88869.1 hypothetical protein E0W69_009445 [Rhizosphaericola mali]
MALNQLQNLIQSLSKFDFETEQERIVSDNKDLLTTFLTNQLSMGLDGNDENIQPQYAPFTIEIKEKYGQGLGAITDRVTFFMTGAFYQGLQSSVGAGVFSFTSPVSYLQDIINRSGQKVLELNIHSREDFGNDILFPKFKEVFKQKTTLVI